MGAVETSSRRNLVFGDTTRRVRHNLNPAINDIQMQTPRRWAGRHWVLLVSQSERRLPDQNGIGAPLISNLPLPSMTISDTSSSGPAPGFANMPVIIRTIIT